MNKFLKTIIFVLTAICAVSLTACYHASNEVDRPPFSYRKTGDSLSTSTYTLSSYDKEADLVEDIVIGGELNALKIASIGSQAFIRCQNIAKVTLTNTVTGIYEHAFSSSSLMVINLSSTVTHIGPNAFNSCSYLASVNLQNTSITYVNDGSFYKCTALTSISIPSGVTGIGEHAFDGCTQLKTIFIPRSVNYLGVACLKSLYIANSSACQIRYEGTETEWDAIVKEVGESYDDNTAGEPMYWYGMGELLYDIVYNCSN